MYINVSGVSPVDGVSSSVDFVANKDVVEETVVGISRRHFNFIVVDSSVGNAGIVISDKKCLGIIRSYKVAEVLFVVHKDVSECEYRSLIYLFYAETAA